MFLETLSIIWADPLLPNTRVLQFHIVQTIFFRCFELEYPNYVKIDVDGIEISVLKGMGDILMSKNLQSIMIEANSRIMEDEMRRMLSHYGFKIDRVQNKSWETAKTRNNFFIK